MRGLSAFDVYLPVLISFVIGVLTLTYLPGRNSQILWTGGRQATWDTGVSGDGSGVMPTGRSRSLRLWNSTLARTNATRCGGLTALHLGLGGLDQLVGHRHPGGAWTRTPWPRSSADPRSVQGSAIGQRLRVGPTW